MTFKGLYARIVWKLPLVEVTKSRNCEVVVFISLLKSLGVCDPDVPLRSGLVPGGSHNLRHETGLGVDVMFPSQALPVCQDLTTLGKHFRPLRVGVESALIHMRRDVTSHTGIVVF